MLMLSELLRFRVADDVGARARLDDLAVALLEGDHPPVTLLLYTGDDGRRRSLKWDSAGVARGEKEIRVKDLGAGRAVAPKPSANCSRPRARARTSTSGSKAASTR